MADREHRVYGRIINRPARYTLRQRIIGAVRILSSLILEFSEENREDAMQGVFLEIRMKIEREWNRPALSPYTPNEL